MKYMGSKSRISKYLTPILTKNLTKNQYYVEPFCGGMNMMCQINHRYRLASDKNNFLIAMWRYLIERGVDFPQTITKEIYAEYRKSFNKTGGFNGSGNSLHEATIGWMGFMGSFNGRFFDGGYSGHDVKGRDYIGEQIRNTLSQIDMLRGVEFACGNYSEIDIPDNSIIYCDIPYKDTKQYLVSKDFNHEKFWDWCRTKTNEGNDVLVSEYQAPDDFVCIWEKEITNAMNTKNTYKPKERLFVHRNIADKYTD